MWLPCGFGQVFNSFLVASDGFLVVLPWILYVL